MIIKDKVYSKFKVTSPIILELVKTNAFQRLKGISQFGLPDKYYHLNGYSRFDHSVGVYILLHKLGASEEEQIAGLLHDISHTAFSHLIDWVFGNGLKEDYQDKRHLSVLKQKEITNVLNKYGFSAENIADYHKFGLLERDLPDLCADRVDYAFRESSAEITKHCFPFLKVFKNEMVFSTEKSALLFAENFLNKQIGHWAGYEAITRYVIFSDLLRKAMQDGVLTSNDFWETDDFVINKIMQTKNKEYLNVLNLLKKKKLDFLPKSKTTIKKKFRHVDPKILTGEKLSRLSEINKKFSEKLKQAKQLNESGTGSGVFS